MTDEIANALNMTEKKEEDIIGLGLLEAPWFQNSVYYRVVTNMNELSHQTLMGMLSLLHFDPASSHFQTFVIRTQLNICSMTQLWL